MILLDTNILVYAADHTASFHHEAKSFRDQAARGRQPACLSPTILTEFYATITDGKRVQRPLTPQAALNELQVYRNVFPIMPYGLDPRIREDDGKGKDFWPSSILLAWMRSAATMNRVIFHG